MTVPPLGRERVEVDMIKFSGPAFDRVDNRLMSLQLVQHGLARLRHARLAPRHYQRAQEQWLQLARRELAAL